MAQHCIQPSSPALLEGILESISQNDSIHKSHSWRGRCVFPFIRELVSDWQGKVLNRQESLNKVIQVMVRAYQG